MENIKITEEYIRPSRSAVLKMSPTTKKKHVRELQRIAEKKYKLTLPNASKYPQQKASQKRYEQSEKGKASLRKKYLKNKMKITENSVST